MTEDEIALIDSNILIYAYEEEESEKKEGAIKLLAKAFANEVEYVVSVQNLAEFIAAYTSKGKGKKELLEEATKGIAEHENFLKIYYDESTILNALNICKNSNTPFWDALIAATMLENNIHTIYTENTKDFAIPGITAINPFVKSGKK